MSIVIRFLRRVVYDTWLHIGLINTHTVRAVNVPAEKVECIVYC